jgi:NAD/NADP transhydrogenase beta subunit
MINWKLIFQLSLFGLAMAIATVFWIPSNLEPAFWLIIFIVCAYLIAKKCEKNFFLHGFLVSMMNCVWIIAAHIIFFDIYMANHPDQAAMSARMPMNPKVVMLIMGPLIGAISGVVLGIFSFIAGKAFKKYMSK